MFAVGEYKDKPGWFFDGSINGTPDLQKATLLHVELRFDQISLLEPGLRTELERQDVWLEPRPVDVRLKPVADQVGATAHAEAQRLADGLDSLIDNCTDDALGSLLQPVADFLRKLVVIR